MRRAIGAITWCAASSAIIGAPMASAAEPIPVASLEDVRAISGVEGFIAPPDGDRTAPLADANAPELCRPVYDPAVVFGAEWSRFRSVVYSAWIDDPVIPDLARVVQEVAVYSDPVAAQQRFAAVTAAGPECAGTGVGFYDKSFEQPDAATVVFDGDGSACAYRVAGTVLSRVCVVVPKDDRRIALDITESLAEANDR